MSVSSHSRSSSLFSLKSLASSCTSGPSSPFPGYDEKPALFQASPRASFVNQSKPQLLSTTFTHAASTHLTFSAFPPCDYHKRLAAFDHLSKRIAQLLLHSFDAKYASFYSMLAGPDWLVAPITENLILRQIPAELCDIFKFSSEWGLFAILKPGAAPTSILSFTSPLTQYVAIRRLEDGFERYIFGSNGLSIHSVCRLVDPGRQRASEVPPETLYLEEEVGVVCKRATKWYYEEAISKRLAKAHEQLRVEWSDLMMQQWSILRVGKKLDLLS